MRHRARPSAIIGTINPDLPDGTTAMSKSSKQLIELSVWATTSYGVVCSCGFKYHNGVPIGAANEDMNAGWWALIVAIAHARVDHPHEFVDFELAPSVLHQVDQLYAATRQLVR